MFKWALVGISEHMFIPVGYVASEIYNKKSPQIIKNAPPWEEECSSSPIPAEEDSLRAAQAALINEQRELVAIEKYKNQLQIIKLTKQLQAMGLTVPPFPFTAPASAPTESDVNTLNVSSDSLINDPVLAGLNPVAPREFEYAQFQY